MSLKKIVLRNKTSISLNERFTFLRQQNERQAVEMAAGPSTMSVGAGRVEAMRQARATLQRASAKNRRLAMQMENRPAVAAALRIKKRNMRQRVGLTGVQPQFASVKDRLTLSARARLGWRGRGVRARGTRGAGRVLSGVVVGGFRVRGGGIPFRRGGLNSPRATGLRARGGQNRGGLRGLGRGSVGYIRPRGRGQNLQQLGGYNNNNFNNNNRRGRGNFSPRTPRGGVGVQRGVTRIRSRRGGRMARGRGQQRGQQRGRGGVPRQNLPVPTRDELDTQLDEYMAGTRAQLDRELEQYMNIQE